MPTFLSMDGTDTARHTRSHREDFAPSLRQRIALAETPFALATLLAEAEALGKARAMARHTLTRCRRAAALRLTALKSAR